MQILGFLDRPTDGEYFFDGKDTEYLTEDELEHHGRKFAAVNSCAGNDFNRGLRAYYFGMAVMAWMVSPWMFMISTTVIVFVLARREFSSPVLKALVEFGEK